MKLGAIFALILALSFILVPLVNADCVELKYDDGESEGSWTNFSEGFQFGVKFSLQATSAILVKARIEIAIPGDFYVHVYDLDGNDLISPLFVTAVSGGWVDVPLYVSVSGDFFIALELIANLQPWIAEDEGLLQGHSFYRVSSTDPWLPSDANLMIRAVVCIPPPVGGELLPNNVSTIGTLIIAVVSTAAITVGMAFKKRKLI